MRYLDNNVCFSYNFIFDHLVINTKYLKRISLYAIKNIESHASNRTNE